jgi:hypothetical protein
MTNAMTLGDKVRDLGERVRSIASEADLLAFLARVEEVAAEADRMEAATGAVRGMAEEALRLDESLDRVDTFLAEEEQDADRDRRLVRAQRIDGMRDLLSEAEAFLRSLALARAVLDSARGEGGGGGEEIERLRGLAEAARAHREAHDLFVRLDDDEAADPQMSNAANDAMQDAEQAIFDALARLDASRAGGGQ